MTVQLSEASCTSSGAANSVLLAFTSKTARQIRGYGECFPCALLLAEAPPEQHADFDALVHDQDFGHSEVLYRATAPVDAVHFIQMGAVKLVRTGPTGEQRIVRVLKTGDSAGTESIFSQTYEHTAIALGDVRVCSIPVALFLKLVAGSGRTQMWLLQKSLTALNDVETWLLQLAGGSVSSRVRIARLMLKLCADNEGHIHRLPLKEMGAIVGLVEETVCRVISEFDRQGIIAKDGSGSVFGQRYFRGNIPALKKIAHEP
ncbi:MAG: Crp/Fnr family transcriptional regulator [Sterolibacterium sp.]|nr:Crp/Fnr family transcriptional regulator [Sterolibacterium sp.]